MTGVASTGSLQAGRASATPRPVAWAAITGLILSATLILLASYVFGGQANRQTASALAQGQAILIADAAARPLSADAGVARAPEALVEQTVGFGRLAELRQIRVVDTLARTVTVLLAPEGAAAPGATRTQITDAQKPLFDYALKARSDMPAEGFAPATGFVGSDGAGFGVQAVRAAGADGSLAAVGMVEVQVARVDVGGGPGLGALGLAGLLLAGTMIVLLTRGQKAAPLALATSVLLAAITAWGTVASAMQLEHLAGDAVSGLARVLAGQVSEGTPLTLQRGADTGALAVTLGLVGLASTGLCWAFTSGAMNRLWETIKTHRTAYAYIAPAIILLILLSFFPFFYGIAMSFTNTSLLNASEPFVDRLNGLDNYAAILGDFNLRQPDTGVLNYQNFYWTAFMTVIWTVTNVFLGVSIGLGLALLLNIKGLQGVAIYRTLLILPWALPNYITALTWKGLFHPQFGAFNSVIQAFGGDPVKWFDTLWPAFFTGLATNAWLSFPFMMVVALGALQSIDQGMYEAAKIDGASPWQRFTMITLPSLKPALLPAIIVSVVWTFNMFNVIFLVSAGQPSGGTEILITRAYKVAFEEYRYGYAAAYSVVIFLILLMYGVFQVRATKATEANA